MSFSPSFLLEKVNHEVTEDDLGRRITFRRFKVLCPLQLVEPRWGTPDLNLELSLPKVSGGTLRVIFSEPSVQLFEFVN